MKIFWIELSNLKYEEFFKKITENKEKVIIFTPNPEILLLGKKKPEFKTILEKANYLIPDWIGIYLAFQIINNKHWKLINFLLTPFYWINLFISRKKLYEKYWDRICWSDLTKDLLEYANNNKLWVTIIDLYFEPKTSWDFEKLEAIKNTIPKLNQAYPNITFHQYIYKEDNKNSIIIDINKTDDVFLFSTLWAYKQEKSIVEIMPSLEKMKLACGIGWSLDFLIWFKKRAPSVFSNLWLEWLWRFFLQPKRMIKRIWNAIFVFIFEVINTK